jgi:hypothetical protein
MVAMVSGIACCRNPINHETQASRSSYEAHSVNQYYRIAVSGNPAAIQEAECEDMNLQVGEVVTHPRYGRGTVIHTNTGAVYPVVVDFEGTNRSFTSDGRYVTDQPPSLRRLVLDQAEDEYIRPTPSIDLGLEIGERVYHEFYGEGTVTHKEDVGTYPVSVMFDEETSMRRGFTLDGRYLRYEPPSLVRLANREHEDVVAI